MAKKLIGSAALTPSSDTGFDLDTKGQIHGYTSTQYALDVGNDSVILVCDSGEASGLKYTENTTSFILACSDETTAISDTGTVLTFYMPYDYTVTAVRASLTTTSSSGTPTIDINDGGTTILSTKITIDAGDLLSTDSATQPVIDDPDLADEAKITIDVDVTGTDATGLKCYIIGYRVAH